MDLPIRLLLGITLILAITSINQIARDSSSFANVDQVMQKEIEFDLSVNFETKVLSGFAIITFEFISATDKIILDTNDLKIHSISSVGENQSLQFFLDTGRTDDNLGTPLYIKVKTDIQTRSKLKLRIDYETSPSAYSIQWMTPNMTTGKKYPFMYTQNESIGARSMLPCQDSPSVKAKIKASLNVEQGLTALFGGLFIDSIAIDGNRNKFSYVQNIPIPTYLIAIAVGNLEYKRLGKRSGVWAEPEVLPYASYEFQEIETFIDVAEGYLTEYEWKVFNILLMPPGFPYGGMENPNLTFVTPSLIAGDRSLSYVIIHELAHSWTGNLVTNANWDNFWLNEGFTVFLERKVIQKINGNDARHLFAQIGYNNMLNDINLLGESHPYTRLNPQVGSDNPDNSFTTIPYEKGFTFLYFLETLIGEDNFRFILQQYMTTYKYQSIVAQNFIDLFTRLVEQQFQGDANSILEKINWTDWINTPGKPLVEMNYNSILAHEAKINSELLLNREDMPVDFTSTFQKWGTQVKILFLQNLLSNVAKLQNDSFQYLIDSLNIRQYKGNFEIYLLWLRIAIKIERGKYLDEAAHLLSSIGRLKFLRDLYSDLFDINHQFALKTFEKNKEAYHPIAISYITSLFNKKMGMKDSMSDL